MRRRRLRRARPAVDARSASSWVGRGLPRPAGGSAARRPRSLGCGGPQSCTLRHSRSQATECPWQSWTRRKRSASCSDSASLAQPRLAHSAPAERIQRLPVPQRHTRRRRPPDGPLHAVDRKRPAAPRRPVHPRPPPCRHGDLPLRLRLARPTSSSSESTHHISNVMSHHIPMSCLQCQHPFLARAHTISTLGLALATRRFTDVGASPSPRPSDLITLY